MTTMHNRKAKGSTIIEIKASKNSSISTDIPDHLKGLEGVIQGYECYNVADAHPMKMALDIFKIIISNRASLYVCYEYRRSFLVNLFLIVLFNPAFHLVYGMNLSAKSINSRFGFFKFLINKVFNRSTKIVVHSIYEAELYARLHSISIDRFVFSHWGYDLPQEQSRKFSKTDKPYVCMVGRNNRDLTTFANAVFIANVHGIVIVPSYTDIDPAIEGKISIYRDLPIADCIDCIRNAAINLTLLLDDQRGAGHITVVTAMHLGIPQIHSDARVLNEYLPFEYLSRSAPFNDAFAVAAEISLSLDKESHDLAERRRVFAKRWLSHDYARKRAREIILKLINGEDLPFIDPEWDYWLRHEKTTDNLSTPRHAY
jgi:hypothetical protein